MSIFSAWLHKRLRKMSDEQLTKHVAGLLDGLCPPLSKAQVLGVAKFIVHNYRKAQEKENG
jgi:hypothetical protein